MTDDHLDRLLGPDDDHPGDENGDVDLAQLRAALARTAHQPTPAPPSTRTQQRERRAALHRRRRRRRRHTLIAVGVLAVLIAGIAAGFVIWRKNVTEVPDFAGPGDTEVVVQIKSGDARTDIASTLQQAGVVASTQAFLNETESDATIAALQPGYYKLRKDSSAREAADDLVNPGNRKGQVRIKPGERWADVTTKADGSGPVVPGFVTTLTKAACVPLNGQSKCWTADALWQAVETADPQTIGVPKWAIESVTTAPVKRDRLEGLLIPGDYDIPPNASPADVLQAIVQASGTGWSTSGIEDRAATAGLTPYQTLVIASIVQRESNTEDMPKVARVVENRIQGQMKLEMDSTVNYALNRASISTTDADRHNPSPYNTYLKPSLPPTPISAPGQDAITATLQPADGSWLYFVLVDKKTRSSCFSTTDAEHQACVDKARKNGVFDE